MSAGFLRVIAAAPEDRRGLFLATANRLGTTFQNVEKDFSGLLGAGLAVQRQRRWRASLAIQGRNIAVQGLRADLSLF